MRRVRAWLVVWVLFVLVARPMAPVALAMGGSTSMALLGGERPRSYREMRYEGVVGQTDWSTCGPAVLATYLTYYVGRKTTEAEMIRLTLGGEHPALVKGSGTSMLQLRDALVHMGVQAAGYQVGIGQLTAYFDRGGPPLILHVTRPEPHYVLAVGMVESGNRRLLFIADPSYGRRLVLPDELEMQFGFAGYVLVPIPPEPLLAKVVARQRDELAREQVRLQRLEAADPFTLSAVSENLDPRATDDPIIHPRGEGDRRPIDLVRLPEEERGDLFVSVNFELSPVGYEGVALVGDEPIGYADVMTQAAATVTVRYAVSRSLSLSLGVGTGLTHHRQTWQGGLESRSLTWRRPKIIGTGLHYQTDRSARGRSAGVDVHVTPGAAQINASLSQIRDPLLLFGSVYYQVDTDALRPRSIGFGAGAAFIANDRTTLRGSMALSLPLSGLSVPTSSLSWRTAYLLDLEGGQEIALYGTWTQNGPETSARVGIEWTTKMSK